MIRISEVKDRALSVLRGRWGSFVGISFIYFLLMSVGGVFTEVPARIAGTNLSTGLVILSIVGIAVWLLMVPMAYGYNIAHLNASRMDMPAEVGDLFCGYKKFWKVLWLIILQSILTGLAACLFIIPGIILALAYSMSMFILHDNPELTVVEALRRSREMMRGYKWDLFVMYLSFLGWILLGILTLFIGYLWLVPYMTMSEYKFYEKILELRAESDSDGYEGQPDYVEETPQIAEQ